MDILHVTKDNFTTLLAEHPRLVLDFWATWCMPCKMLAPVLAEIAAERPDVAIGKVDVDESPELAAQFRVMSIPTLVYFRDGAAAEQTVGVIPKDRILEIIDNL